jgi:hypothetical protein
MELKGADISPFAKSQEQIQFEQQLAAWQNAAAMAAKAGTPFSTPMPQPSPQLQKEMQTEQQAGGTDPTAQQRTTDALSSTQGTQ